METKKAQIHFLLSAREKDDFFKAAGYEGEVPSILLRRFVRQFTRKKLEEQEGGSIPSSKLTTSSEVTTSVPAAIKDFRS